MSQQQYLYNLQLSATWSWVQVQVACNGRLHMHLVVNKWVPLPVLMTWIGTARRSFRQATLSSSVSSISFQKRRHWMCSTTDTCPFSTATALLARLRSVSFKNGGSIYFEPTFPAGAKCPPARANQIAPYTCSNTSTASFTRQLCLNWRQNGYYAILAE